MRLKQIKLAGFKSFVDVTKVPFPHQMTAVVGPNGCGKSNIIDAVRWVLGESSAKNLRGDAMTDVIFNGSTERKPVGQASVELIFENSDQTPLTADASISFQLSEQLASRSEIAIKRVVNRDGQNQYYLNGSKCRRKDITDVFLGSGLGPRSYAIIEQGMISRLIESKPQELRVFVEEAAGVSKYKERRRETELKLKHTGENLQRLGDISQEIGVHLDVLASQAEQASQYRELKATERELKSKVAIKKFVNAESQLKQIGTAITQLTQQTDSIKQQLAKQRNLTNEQEQLIEQHYSQANQLHLSLTDAKQTQTRIEQQLASGEQLRKSAKQRIENYQAKHQQQLIKSKQHQSELTKWQASIDKLLPELNDAEQKLTGEQATLSLLEQQVTQLELKITEQTKVLLAQKERKLAEQQAQFANQQALLKLSTLRDEKQSRLSELNNEPQPDLAKWQVESEKLTLQLSQQQKTAQQLAQNIDHMQTDIVTQENALATVQQQVNKLTAKQQQLAGQLAIKTDWQSDCLNRFTQLGIHAVTPYRDVIKVEPKWQAAVFNVLGNWLNAYLLTEHDFNRINELTSSQYWLINRGGLTQQVVPDTLASVVQSKMAKSDAELGVLPMLNNFLLAESREQAIAKLPNLPAHHWLVTPEGVLFSAAVICKGSETNQVNSLALQTELTEVEQQLTSYQAETKKYQQLINQLRAEKTDLDKTLTATANTINNEQLALQQAQQQYAFAQEKSQQQTNSQQQLQAEISELDQQINRQAITADNMATVTSNEASEHSLIAEQESDKAQLAKLVSERASNQLQVSHLIGQVQQLRHQQQQYSLSVTQSELKQSHATEQLLTIEEQIHHYQDELNQLPALDELTAKLAAASQTVEQIKEKVAHCDTSLHQAQQQKASLTQQIQVAETSYNQLNDKHHQQALKKEQLSFELNAAKNELAELNELHQPLEFSKANDSLVSYQKQLKQVAKQLLALGAVNLAAIDEFQLQQQRKNQIDLQIEDLTQAIATLESAITKIDKESRQKFKTTFEQINHDFSALFPKVFGGGQAYLALTSNDLLDTGVSIMARPPGKKNSTIHLLSGGEKALTALSLVFAIFRLNPAPFCMLDEVDAPLDDANVERFCNLVREMSKTVQFIYISHNKIAMEMASHLTGVTMMEPGVSRMVSVDIDEAIAMAEVS